MIDHYPVIAVIPSGRERYMRVLIPHLLRSRRLVDQCHLWINTENPADLAYLAGLEQTWPDFFRCVPCPVRVEGNLSIACFYTQTYRVSGSIFLKIDDDIVWLAPDALERLLRFRVANPDYFLVFANLWNNQIMDHSRQRSGLLPQEIPIEWNACGSTWRSGQAAEAIHREFLRGRASGMLDRWSAAIERIVLQPSERVSINLVAWLGQHMAALGQDGLNGPFPGGDDEHHLCCVAPGKLQRYNAVCGAAQAVHFAFYPQREHMDRTGILEEYAALAPPVQPFPRSA